MLMHEPFCATLLLGALALAAGPAQAQNKVVKIYGFGAKSGVVRIFGLNSEAARRPRPINKAGGVTLGDGSKARLAIEYLDDRCNAEEDINALRRIAAQPEAVVARRANLQQLAEPVFGILQKKRRRRLEGCSFRCARTCSTARSRH